MNGRFPREQQRRVGSDRRCGAFCGIRRTKTKTVSAKQNCVLVNASRNLCVNAIGRRTATAPIMNGPVKSGSRFLFPHWSAKTPSLSRKNSCKRINIIRPDVRSNPPCFRACLFASTVAMRFIARQRGQSKRKLYYYRCLGSDAYRHLKGSVCSNRPIRQDYLDEFVWKEIIHLLDGPALIQAEIDRRMQAARNADPLRKREQ